MSTIYAWQAALVYSTSIINSRKYAERWNGVKIIGIRHLRKVPVTFFHVMAYHATLAWHGLFSYNNASVSCFIYYLPFEAARDSRNEMRCPFKHMSWKLWEEIRLRNIVLLLLHIYYWDIIKSSDVTCGLGILTLHADYKIRNFQNFAHNSENSECP